MKKLEMKFNKNSVKKYAVYLIEHRRIFFAVFFGALFIFTFNVIYENVYYNMKHIDYVKSKNFEDDEVKRNIIFGRVVENIKFREQTILDVKNKEYKDPFIFNDGKDFNENNNDREENNNNENNNENGENSDGSDNNVSVVLPIEPSTLP